MTLPNGRGAEAVFLDRDGTLIEEVGYLDRAERVELYPYSADALRALNRAGLRIVMVTNQSGVARGFFSESEIKAVHAHIERLLADAGAHIDAYYYCPHHPDGKVVEYARVCDCRKPGRGLVDSAARALGGAGVSVRTGYGLTEEQKPVEGLEADAVVDNLAAAASWILRARSSQS